jgi:hypothetical protein
MWYIFNVYFSLKEVVVLQGLSRERGIVDKFKVLQGAAFANEGRGVHGNIV